MQRLAFIGFILVVIIGVYFFNQDKLNFGLPGKNTEVASRVDKPSISKEGVSLQKEINSLVDKSKGSPADENAEDDELYVDDGVTAPQMFKTAAEAIDAVKKGSTTYDDTLLQRFVNINNCSWCAEFYSSVRDLATNNETDLSQRGFFAELLAISGNLDNMKWLVGQVESLKNEQEQEVFAEAIEFASGDDEMVKYLSNYLENPVQILKEGAAAAITNQGSRLAAETLYKFAQDSKNPDGMYSLGLGLGELVPSSEEVLPYLQEIIQKRDEYSHLGVKALFNAGLPGIHMVFDTLAGSKDPELDRALLTDAADHIPYDDETKEYLISQSEKSNNPILKEFAQNVLKDFDIEEDEDKD